MEEILREIRELKMRLAFLETKLPNNYKGTSSGDFNTTTLPHHGNYGFQTTANELQMNCNGTIRAVAMATL